MQPLETESIALAYQRIELQDIRRLFEEVCLDLEHYTELEDEIGKGIEELNAEAREVQRALEDAGANLDETIPVEIQLAKEATDQKDVSYRLLEILPAGDSQEILDNATERLLEDGLDLKTNPLLQVLSTAELSRIGEAYRDKFGVVEWDDADYVVVCVAGFVAAILDICVVIAFRNPAFILQLCTVLDRRKNSQVADWLRQHSKKILDAIVEMYESGSVPYEAIEKSIENALRSRLSALRKEDPLLGLVLGMFSLMQAMGIYIDKNGIIVRSEAYQHVDQDYVIKVFVEFLADRLTELLQKTRILEHVSSLLQMLKQKLPVVLDSAGHEVSWTELGGYMRNNGYDPAKFFSEGLVPASIEIIVRGWWLLSTFMRSGDIEKEKLKLASMLMTSHTIALSGQLTIIALSQNLIFIDPFEAHRFLLICLAWVKETIKRDVRLQTGLKAEWNKIYEDAVGVSP